MGIFRNIVVKTAVKKALLDVTNEIEEINKSLGNAYSFGDVVLFYAKNNPSIETDLIDETWEATFFGVVAHRAQSEMPSSYLINNEKEFTVVVSLILEWVHSYGGDLSNITKKIKG